MIVRPPRKYSNNNKEKLNYIFKKLNKHRTSFIGVIIISIFWVFPANISPFSGHTQSFIFVESKPLTSPHK